VAAKVTLKLPSKVVEDALPGDAVATSKVVEDAHEDLDEVVLDDALDPHVGREL
jgi:hypothetical protein